MNFKKKSLWWTKQQQLFDREARLLQISTATETDYACWLWFLLFMNVFTDNVI